MHGTGAENMSNSVPRLESFRRRGAHYKPAPQIYVDVDDIIYAGVYDDKICPDHNKIKRRCLPDPEKKKRESRIFQKK
jgi:hypothetical protein